MAGLATRLLLLMWVVLAAVPRAAAAPLTDAFACPLIASHLMSAGCRATLLTPVSTASSSLMTAGVADVDSSFAAAVLAWTGGLTPGEPLHVQFSMAPGRGVDGPIAQLRADTLWAGINLHGVDDCRVTCSSDDLPGRPEPVAEPAMLLIAGASGLGFGVRRRRRLGLGLTRADSFLYRSQRKEAVRPASIITTCSAVNRAKSVAPLRI